MKAAEVRVATGAATPDQSQSMDDLRQAAPELADQVAQLERAEAKARMERDWQRLRVADVIAVENPAAHLADVRKFLRDYPDTSQKAEAVALARELEAVVSRLQARDERLAVDSLARAATLPDASWRNLIDQARQFLDDHPDTQYRAEVDDLIKVWLVRQDETDIARARRYAQENPTNFTARREKFADYLRDHRHGGRFVAEANAALARIDAERDVYLYRQAFDHRAAHPDDVPAVAARLRAYLDANPEGRFVEAARRYLDWWQQISVPGQYRVTLRRGQVEPTVGKPLAVQAPTSASPSPSPAPITAPRPSSRTPARPSGTTPSPSPSAGNTATPSPSASSITTGPRPTSSRFTTPPGDKLAMRLLSGTIKPQRGGRTELVFASDFREPSLPRPE